VEDSKFITSAGMSAGCGLLEDLEALAVLLGYSDIGLAIRGSAIGLLARVRYDDLPADIAGG
jgi:hypothetical protein